MKLHLDTLNKKPKVYNLAVLAALVGAALGLLVLLGGEGQLPLGCLLLALGFLTATGLLIRAWRRQIRYNLYSYNTIIYFGFALFTLSVTVSYLVLFFRLRDAEGAAYLHSMLGSLLSSAKTYIVFSAPFLLIFSLAMIASNLSLIRHEGFRPVNLLGIVLAVLLLGGAALLYLRDFAVSGSREEVMRFDLVTNLLAAGYLYFECMILGAMAADALAARYEPAKDKDFILVLGCAIRRDGTPTPLLRGRLERALAFSRAQQAQGGKAPCFVLSGGQGSDEVISEAECMRRWLAEQGVPAEQMLLEERSTDTAENMRFSKELILARNPAAKVAFSTTNYHVFRAGLKARRVKLRAQGMGCRSKWYFWPNAAVREFAGLLTQHRGKQLLILLGLLLSYAAMTLIYYNV